jgi:hypothetical protein
MVDQITYLKYETYRKSVYEIHIMNERGSEHQISLLRLAIYFRTSKVSFEFITTTTKIRLLMF